MSIVTPESEILKPLTADQLSEQHEDEWPEFFLKNAIVTDKAGSIVSLGSASDRNLLVVSGELVQRRDQSKFYVSGLKRKSVVHLEVNPVGRYAFGISEEDKEEIWAAGKAGWFAIQPATAYNLAHAEMREGIRLWYSIVDNTKLQNATAKDLYIPFMKKKDLQGRTEEEVFRHHASFILQQMEKSLARWSKKPLYQYLKKSHKEIKAEPVTRISRPTMTDTSQAQDLKRRGRPLKASVAEVPKTPLTQKKISQTPMDELHRIETDAAILWKFLQRYALRVSGPTKLDFAKITILVNDFYIFDNERQAANYIRFQSKYLLQAMSDRRERKYWKDSPIYQDLMESKLNTSMVGKMAKIVLQVRMLGDSRPAERMGKDGLDFYISSDEEIHPRQGKSALRPKSGGKGKSYTANIDIEEDDLSPSSATPRKRKLTSNYLVQRRSKRRALSPAKSSEKTSSEKTSSIQDESDHIIEIEGEESQPTCVTLPLRWRNIKESKSNQTPPVLLKGATLKIGPNAPGDVWHCTTSGCMHTVYGASGNLGKRLIDEHMYEHHEEEAPPEVDVIMKETKKTNLPVSNLIRRIREFAAAQELAEAMAIANNKVDLQE